MEGTLEVNWKNFAKLAIASALAGALVALALSVRCERLSQRGEPLAQLQFQKEN